MVYTKRLIEYTYLLPTRYFGLITDITVEKALKMNPQKKAVT